MRQLKLKTDKSHLFRILAQVEDFISDGKEYEIIVQKAVKHRSLDSNSYLWALVGQMAEVLNQDKDAVYYEMLKRYGVSIVVKIKDTDRDRFFRSWKYVEQHEKLPPEERAQYYKVYLGSSVYDTQEMSVLLNGVVSECEELGIPTEANDRILSMLNAWERKVKDEQKEHAVEQNIHALS